ncbi:MAG: YbaB/EbfC family nucleoid-associated protein [Candidatus Kerfeldbacteria bacterium]|nr:YbaB/EbfC family nucleoid-associated protein [Candidatus Kerfeldbacteria bacterium]
MAMFSKLKQYKDLRDQAKTMQNALAEEIVHVDGAHGKIQMIIDGNQQLNGLEIADDLVQPGKKQELERALKDTFNSAIKKAQMAMAKKAKEMGHLNLPGLS